MKTTALSPKAQAVLDAYESTVDKYKAIAAAIRALVNQGDCIEEKEDGESKLVGVVRDSVSFAIADELEAL